jgi:tuftelin-interacting protein 11
MLEVDFFGKWLQALHELLSSSDPDFVGIMNWYTGWRDSFPPELLANERIRMLLETGLSMMNRAAEGLEEVAQPATRENPGYAAQQTSDCSSDRAARGGAEAMADLNFKECIQAYAAEHGLLFMPRAGKLHNGFQMYQFGTASIYIDSVKGLPFAQLQEGKDAWSSVSLTELLEMNQLAKPCC